MRAEFCKRATSVNKFTNSAVAFKLFSLSLGQLISDRVTEIVEKYDSKVYSTKYDDQLATRPASAAFDDSYLGMWWEMRNLCLEHSLALLMLTSKSYN